MSKTLRDIAAWVTDLTWGDVPEAARSRARLAARDAVATAVGGFATPAARIAQELAVSHPGNTPVIGTGRAAQPAFAAFANAVASSSLDFDDGHQRGGAIHASSAIVPALLAASDDATTVADFLTAAVAGYEVALRAAHVMFPRAPGDFYHSSGMGDTIAAAVAVAKLRRFDAEQVERTVKIAWQHAPLASFTLPMIKESIGWAAHTGLVAADLAGLGFMSSPAPVDDTPNHLHPQSPFHVHGAVDDPYVTSIGDRFECSDLYIKRFACCAYTHAAAEGLLTLMAEHEIGAQSIERIDLYTHRSAVFLDDPEPADLDSAQFSFQFVLASAACFGRVGADEMTVEGLTDPVRLELASKITVSHDPALDAGYPAAYPTRLEIHWGKGRRVEGSFDRAPAFPRPGFGIEEAVEKCRLLLTRRIGAEAAERMVDGFENDRSPVLELMSVLWGESA